VAAEALAPFAMPARRAAISPFMAMMAREAVVSQTAGTSPWTNAAPDALNNFVLNLNAKSMCSK
jgi:hypothetical protein